MPQTSKLFAASSYILSGSWCSMCLFLYGTSCHGAFKHDPVYIVCNIFTSKFSSPDMSLNTHLHIIVFVHSKTTMFTYNVAHGDKTMTVLSLLCIVNYYPCFVLSKGLTNIAGVLKYD